MDIPEIVDCAGDISKYYDHLIEMNNRVIFDGIYNKTMKEQLRQAEEYNHKKALWLALMSVNVLEGIRFYVSFACSWAFAEVKKM